ncbi:MAG: alternative ribosome rescue aminoacyl-tRNA hydrolase ArfB [Pirellulales bacterium]|nr:alternative ribosome rescue aminoacyl-tRNA hydrolase ArfB [Pirellulales bacterium]
MPLVISSKVAIPDQELNFSFARSSGPGGQNVNKVNSKAILHWPVVSSAALPPDIRARFLKKYHTRINNQGELVLHSQLYRDQPQNEEDCRQKLKAMITSVLYAPKVRKATKPTKSSQHKRLDTKRTQSAKKQNRRQPRREE